MPRLRVSAAMAPATSLTNPASHVAARPIAWGNAVAPGPTRPWRASSKGMIGIPSLVSPTKYFWMVFELFGRAPGVRDAPDLEPEDAVFPGLLARVKIARDHEQLAELLLGRHPR